MSYTLIPYLVDLPTLRKAIGSGDRSLIDAIRKKDKGRFDDNGGYALSMGEALEHLVMGQPLGKEATHQYGYALEALCDQLGKPLLPDLWSGVRWDAVEDGGLADVVESGSPIPLPKINDFPCIGHLTRLQVAERAASGGLSADDDELQELLDEFNGWIDTAAEAKLDIVFFYY